MTTSLKATNEGAQVSVTRNNSKIEFTTPLSNSTLKKENGNAIYSIPEKNLQLRYSFIDKGIKEDIVLYKIPTVPLLNSNLKTTNLITKISPEGLPVFYDKSENYQFHIEPPFARDGAGSITYGLRYHLIKKDKNIINDPNISQYSPKKYIQNLLGPLKNISETSYTLALEIDDAWLHDPKRVLPITIDPTIVHDTQSEFATGQMNRVQDLGTGNTAPSLSITSQQELIPDTNTIALWHMNETTGTTLADASGNGYTATLATGTSAPGLGITSILNTGTSYGGNDYASVGATIPGIKTVEFWAYITNPASNYLIYLSNIDVSGIFSNTSGNLATNISNSTFYVNGLQSNILIANSWNHIAVTTNTSFSTGVFKLGKAKDQSDVYFTGLLDEVRLSSVARSAEEIRLSAQRRPYAVYTSPLIDLTQKAGAWNSLSWTESGVATGDGETLSSGTSLVAQWNFNETGGTSAVSGGSCGTTCNGTLTNFTNTNNQDSGSSFCPSIGTGGTITYTDSNDLNPSASPYQGGYVIHTFKGSGTFTPNSTANITVEAVGAGGDGGKAAASSNAKRGGGGGGAYSKGSLTVNSATAYTVSVGTAGGSDSYFSSATTVMAKGGTNNPDSTTGSAGGDAASGYGNIVKYSGGNGGNGNITPGDGGGGGGGAGTGGNGGNATGQPGGIGTTIYGGNGGGGATVNNGSAGSIYGGGGGGGANAGGTTVGQGGAGAQGIVVIKYLYNNPSLLCDNNSGWTSNSRKWGAGAINFDGVDDYVNLINPSTLNISGSLTIEAWIKGLNFSSGVNTIVGKWGVSNRSYKLAILNGKLYLDLSNSGTGDNYRVSNQTLISGLWYHVAGVYISGTTPSINLYINGTLDIGTTVGTIPNSLYSVLGNVEIGRDSSNLFSGTIDSTRIYSRALSASEILSNYNAGNLEFQTRTGSSSDPNDGTWTDWSPSTGETQINSFDSDIANWSWDNTASTMPVNKYNDTITKLEGSGSMKIALGVAQTDANTVGLWHLDETSGTSAYIKDISGNNTSCTPYGTVVTNGIFGKARWFDGSVSTNYINCTSISAALKTSDTTLQAWIKTNTVDTGGAYIFTVGYGSMITLSNTGQARASIYNGSIYQTVTGQTIVTDNNWHHIAGVFDNTNNLLKIYVDGVFENSIGSTETISYGTAMDIGRNVGTTTTDFTGIIDEIKVSGIALSDEEIAESYRMGRDHYLNKTISSTDLSGKTTIPFYVAADRPGTYLTATAGESPFANYQPDANTVGLWHLDDNIAPPVTNAVGGTITYVDSAGLNSRTTYPYAEGFTIHTFNGSGTFTPNSTISNVTVEAVGAGGNGGKANAGSNAKRGGGGGGAYSKGSLTVNSATAYTVSVGTAGGSDSYFNSTTTVMAKGGTNNPNATAGSAGGDAASGYGNIVKYSGGNGGNGDDTPGDGGGGGGGAGTGGNGGNATGRPGGIGTTIYGGNGGNGATTNDGSAGSIYGGGGGGGANAGGVTVGNGGAGAQGVVIVKYPSSNTTVKDASGNSNIGTVINATFTQGKIGNARNFDGVSNYIINGNLSNPTILTASTWIKSTNTTNSQFILSQGRDNYCSGYGLSINTGILSWNINTNSNDDGCEAQLSIGFTDTSNWHYVAGTYDGTTAKLYLDGKLVNSAIATTTGNIVYKYNEVFNIGKMAYSDPSLYFPFSGSIDEVRVDNVVRTADEIRQAYEVGLRSHPITIDFAASLVSSNLIIDSSDYSFNINAISYGLGSSGANLYLGDKIIIKENIGGTEYLAQGTVNSVNSSTGAVTVSSYDAGSTFPATGFTANATVFKWQTEYFDITGSLPSHRNTITQLTLRFANGNEGRSIWLDDLKSAGSYLTNSIGSTITSSLANRYFQYRSIFSTTDYNLSPSLSSLTLDYVENTPPLTPTLVSPGNGTTAVTITPPLVTVTTDANASLDYLQYKINLCTDSAMTTDCSVFDQTVSNTNWSGQDIGTSAYSSGTTATYSIQTTLTANTTYYWKSLAIDPNGTNTWGNTQSTPFSFTTFFLPSASNCRILENDNKTTFTLNWADNANNEEGYDVQRSANNGAWTNFQTGLSVGTTGITDSTILPGGNYIYRVAPYKETYYAPWCSTVSLSIGNTTNSFKFDGLKMDGLKLN